MPKSTLYRLTFAAVAVFALLAGLAQAAENGTRPALKRVENKKVCMVNNAAFEKDQIPVAVEGKTYYGCCEMCKEKLAKDFNARTGVDPVTGNKVDKAVAVIAAQTDGTVLYFESDKTLERYEAGERKK
jgi:YHS domain-containing protein